MMLVPTQKRACPCALVRLFVCSRAHPDTHTRTEAEVSRKTQTEGWKRYVGRSEGERHSENEKDVCTQHPARLYPAAIEDTIIMRTLSFFVSTRCLCFGLCVRERLPVFNWSGSVLFVSIAHSHRDTTSIGSRTHRETKQQLLLRRLVRPTPREIHTLSFPNVELRSHSGTPESFRHDSAIPWPRAARRPA